VIIPAKHVWVLVLIVVNHVMILRLHLELTILALQEDHVIVKMDITMIQFYLILIHRFV
jgi:hypothetical protein